MKSLAYRKEKYRAQGLVLFSKGWARNEAVFIGVEYSVKALKNQVINE